MVAAPVTERGVHPHSVREWWSETSERLDPNTPWACFDNAKDWRVYLDGWRRSIPCGDCNPEYQAEMVQQGRCRHPETEFLEEDGQTFGYRNPKDKGRASRWKDH